MPIGSAFLGSAFYILFIFLVKSEKKIQIQFSQTGFIRDLQGNQQHWVYKIPNEIELEKSATSFSLDLRYVFRSPAFQGHF